MSNEFTRREVIKSLAASAAFGAVGVAVAGHVNQSATPQLGVPIKQRRRAIRLAHLTDVHVKPELRANLGMIACLHHAQLQADKPELILTGGDAVFDTFEADNTRTHLLWDMWRSILKAECSTPLEHCIGNHDIWGGNKAKSKTTGSEPNYGKKRAIEMFGISDRYRSFDKNGWHFIVLDSTQPEGDGYKAFLDEPQFEWLASDLKAVNPNTPVLVLSHIPIVTTTVMMIEKDQKRSEWKIDGSIMHLDAIRLKNLFDKHKNVKLCLSGHMHLVDRVDYNDVTYFCNGAVSGNWWKGKHKECSEGYAMLDLFDDGSFERQYVTYGWKAEGA